MTQGRESSKQTGGIQMMITRQKIIARVTGLMLSALSANAALIAHWTFDDTLTNAVSSAYGAVSSGTGTPQYSTDAIYGKSLLFANPSGNLAVTDKLTILNGGDWAGVSSWTFSAWIKPTTLGTTQTVFSASGTVNGAYTLYSQLRGTAINTYYKLDDTTSTGTGAVSWGGAVGDWYRLTVVFDSANQTVTEYRDSSDAVGGLVMLKSASNLTTSMTLSGFELGAVANYFGFQGYMDDVLIYDTALSSSEVDVIPEPATIGLFGLAGAIVFMIRRTGFKG